MSCTIKYNNQDYTYEGFEQYMRDNPLEFDLSEDVFYSASVSNDLLSSKASPAAVQFSNEFLKRIGVDVEVIDEEVSKRLVSTVGGNSKQKAYGIADLVNDVAWILEGKEDVALTEEAMHFAVAIMKAKNPSLYKRMFNSIGQYNITNRVINDPGYRNIYSIDGKPDIPKLKEEAIGKVLAEYVVKGVDGVTEKPDLIAKSQSWWEQILDWFRVMFNKVGLNIASNPFEEASSSIISGNFEGSASDIQERDIMLSQGTDDPNIQSTIYDSIKNTSQYVVRTDNGYAINGVPVKNRVSDLKKKRNTFGARSKEDEEFDTARREFGTKGHMDIEDIARRYIDENGYVKKDSAGNLNPDPQVNVSQLAPEDKRFYDALEENFRERLLDITSNLSKNTRFLIESIIYDKNKDEAGTMDFVAIQEDGTTDILDWKFINNTDPKTNDVQFWQRQGYDIQLTEYKRILKDVYNIQKIGKTRAIPIVIKYLYKDNIYTVKSLSISKVNVDLAEYDYDLPVPVTSERTGTKELDKQIDKLQALYSRVSESLVVEGRKDIKAEQLNNLLKTIRYLQVKQDISPTLDYVDILDKESDILLDTYKDRFQGKNVASFSDEEIADFAGRILDIMDKYIPFDDILDLDNLFESDSKMSLRIADTNKQVKKKEKQLNNLLFQFGEEFLGKRNNVAGLVIAEKEYKGIASQLSPISMRGTSGSTAYYNLVDKYINKMRVEQNLALQDYQDIANEYNKWADSKGLKGHDRYSLIFRPTKKGEFKNERIDTIDKQFFTDFKKALQDRNGEWIQDNIDVEEYKKYAANKKAEEFELANAQIYSANPETDASIRAQRIESIQDRYNFTNDTSSGYFQIQLNKFPKEKWYSKEYKELLKPENKAVLDLFNYITDTTTEASSLGMISPRIRRTFLPYIRKYGTAEKLIFNNNAGAGETIVQKILPLQGLIDNITIQDDDYGYGYRDPLTGEFKYDLRPKYTSPIFDERPEELSTDLLKTMQRFTDEVIRYKNLSSIKGAVEGILKIEELKTSIQTNGRGRIVTENGIAVEQDNNTKNYEFLLDHVKSSFYGVPQKEDQLLDITLGKISDNWEKNFKKINEKVGFKLMPEDIAGKQIYLPKVMDTLKNFFQLKTLGFNIGIPLANTIGGTFQRFINAGEHYSESDIYKAYYKTTSLAFNDKEGKVTLEILRTLTPYLEQRPRDKSIKVAGSKLGDTSFIQDVLMTPYKYGTRIVELVHAVAMLESAIVINGEVLNVNTYLRNKYNDRFTIPYQDRKNLLTKIDKEKQELLKSNGLLANSTISKDKVQLPDNLSFTDSSLLKYRSTTINLAKQFLGASTPEDKNRANMSAIWSTFLVFKNWIPPLLEPRISELKYAPGTDRWEMGRYRMIAKAVGNGALFKTKGLRDLMLMNDNGVKFMGDLLNQHREEYKKRTGKDLNIDKSTYIDIYQRGIKNQMKDVLFYLTIVGIVLSASAYLEDNEDPETRGWSTLSIRMLNKVRDELEFYYNPKSFVEIANGNVLPPLSLVNDVSALLSNIWDELYGLSTENDELVESAKPLKYLLRLHPLTNNLMYYAGVASPDFAHSLGIKITSQARSR